jgi:hypothetical protein
MKTRPVVVNLFCEEQQTKFHENRPVVVNLFCEEQQTKFHENRPVVVNLFCEEQHTRFHEKPSSGSKIILCRATHKISRKTVQW